MSKSILLLSVANIKERSSLHGNVDEKMVLPTIKICQDMYIRPALGSTLYDRLIDGIDNDNLNSDEQNLIDNYIADALTWYVLSELPVQVIYQFYAKAVVKKTDNSSDALSQDEIINIENRHKKYAEHYKNEIIKYLKAHISLFPEYMQYTAELDRLAPERSGFSTSIYLGDADGCWVKKPLAERYQGKYGICTDNNCY